MSDISVFDQSVLKAVNSRPGAATYVLRNIMARKDNWWGCGYWPGLETSDVLRACRRLQKRGLIEEAPTAYVVMKCWQPTHPRQESGHG